MNLKKFSKYGTLNSHDIFKFVAMALMIIDHIGLYFFKLQAFRLVGRLCIPILATIYGYYFKNKVDKNLLIWGSPLVILDLIIKKTMFPLNILFSFYISGKVLEFYNLNKYKLKEWDRKIIFPLLLILHFYIVGIFEYGIFIILFVVCGILFREGNNKNRYISILVIFWLYLMEQILHFNFNAIYSVILLILLSYTFLKLKGYRLEEFKKPIDNRLKNIIMFVSRYSMEIYTIHLILFRVFCYLANLQQKTNPSILY